MKSSKYPIRKGIVPICGYSIVYFKEASKVDIMS